jgi:hypothetical protein
MLTLFFIAVSAYFHVVIKSQYKSVITAKKMTNFSLSDAHAASEEGKPKPVGAEEKGEMKVIPLSLTLIDSISSIRVYLPRDLRPVSSRQAVLKSVSLFSHV